MDIEKCKNEFKKYVSKYDIKEPEINRKFYHSYRVMNFCLLIAKYNNFNKRDTEIAVLAGLLHDYARFEQWTKYKTFSDIDSIDHADCAAEKLFNNKEIINYCIDESFYDDIYYAIKYHNKLDIPDNLNKHNTLMCKVIRDADKLDIFSLLGDDKNLMQQDDNIISSKISNDFFDEKPLNAYDVKSKNDKLILLLAMIFDLNFKYSFEYIKEKKLIHKMYDNIVDKPKFKKYFDFINKYIDERLV